MTYDPAAYQDYAALTAILQAMADQHPALCTLSSLATSPQGRSVWLLTLTNRATGPDTEKPGFLVDGCHHATELTSTAQAVYLADWLLRGYGEDPEATELLDTRAIYLLPRLTVDGSDAVIHSPHRMRSRMALWPEPEEKPGLTPADIDGDGTIREMRVQDPLGEWKVSQKDPRLMVRRQPDDREGTFYKVYTEGVIRELRPDGLVEAYDGRGVKVAAPAWGLDFNRNYPINWAMQHRQPGAGPVPFSEPEVRGYAEFVIAHPNICGWTSYHTTGGVLLRPGATQRDEKLDPADLQRYKALGDMGARITGYPHRNLFEIYTVDPERPTVGSTMEWAYDYLGMIFFGPELWDVQGLAGNPSWGKRSVKEIMNLSDEEKEEQEWRLLAWSDQENGGRGFAPWRAFRHPQLGAVELGGWDALYFLGNPPPGKWLQAELAKNLPFAVKTALATPRLQIGRVEVKPLGKALFEVAVQVRNRGFLPTQVCEVAVQQKRVRGVALTLQGAAVVAQRGARLENGRYLLGEIPGHGNDGEKWAVFVLRGEAGSEITVTARHDRAGQAMALVRLQ